MSKRNVSSEEKSDNMFKKPKLPSKLMIDEYSNENHRRVNFHSLDQYTRHKLLINYYQLAYPGTHQKVFERDRSNDKGDIQVLQENHRFIWSDEDLNSNELTWGQRVAKKYYERLFKEYCIIDLSHYKENKFGMRWRTETEVFEGKGQFICGAKRCLEKNELTSWEVLFGYMEHGKKQSALVKIRLCMQCSVKLNYHRQYKKIIKNEKRKKSMASKIIIDDKVNIKEEIMSEDEIVQTGHNKDKTNEESYEDLIDRIWRQPVKVETEDDLEDIEKNQKEKLENDLNEYLDQFFM